MRCERCGKPLPYQEAITTADREIICHECLNTNEKTPLEGVVEDDGNGNIIAVHDVFYDVALDDHICRTVLAVADHRSDAYSLYRRYDLKSCRGRAIQGGKAYR